MRCRASLCPVFLLACLAFCGACNLNNPGDEPPRGLIYFPTALGISAQSATVAPRYLYLANSNFDLRYNAGSLQVYDLDLLDKEIAKSCSKNPSIDCTVSSSDALVDEVLVSSFATGIAVSPDRSHLYVTTRTNPSLTYVDLDEAADGDKVLQCGSPGRHCDADHNRGGDPIENPRRVIFPDEAVSLTTGKIADAIESTSGSGSAASNNGNFVLVAHRGGQVSLFLDGAQGQGKTGPVLVDVLSGLITEPTGIAFDNNTRLAYLSVYDRAQAVPLSKVLDRVGLSFDPITPEQSFLYDAGSLELGGVANSRDTRALAFSTGQPAQALVVSHEPSALLWVDVPQLDADVSDTAIANARRTVELAGGPSRLTMGLLGTQPIVAVSCFDPARQIFVLDAQTGQVLSVVHNLSGPFELAIDSFRKRLYVADFRSSVVRVLDLSPIITGSHMDPTSARIVATLGAPKIVQELR